MIFLAILFGVLLAVIVGYSVVARRREAAARRAWEARSNEKALANDAALFARMSEREQADVRMRHDAPAD